MKSWKWLMGFTLLCIAPTCLAEVGALDDDVEYEEVVIRRRKKKKSAGKMLVAPQTPAGAVLVAPVAVIPSGVTTATAVAEKEEPPPEPPASEAAEPRRLVRYFCKVWKDKDYERLWWAMTPRYRKNVSLKKFSGLFEADAELNGGLLDENILQVGKTRKGNEGVKVELIFKFPRAKHKFVMAETERQPGGAYRVTDCTLIPVDLDDL